jgi:hypothetical protein
MQIALVACCCCCSPSAGRWGCPEDHRTLVHSPS